MKIEALKDKKILIVGYGQEGKATEEFLKAKVPEAKYEIVDQSMGPEYLSHQKDFDLAIRSPGVKPSLLTIPYTTPTNIFFANIGNHQMIGVTGTKGKSTTASLIAHIMSSAGHVVKLVGNIGNPLIRELLNPPTTQTLYVCELSSYQLVDIQYSPHISVIVSLFPDHLNYHGSLDQYYNAKKQMILHATQNDFYIFNPTFKQLQDWKTETKAQPVPYETDFIPTAIPLLGEHNVDNVRGAITVARLFNISNDQVQQAVQSFKPLPHRLQNIGTYRGITFYDDAISTTPESTIAALKAIAQVRTILLGGLNRGYSFAELVRELKDQNVTNVVLFPDSGTQILEEMQKQNYIPRILETQDMEKAVQFAYEHTPTGGVCLLSTASPSYSIWKNFEEKGDKFQSFVTTYANEKKNP